MSEQSQSTIRILRRLRARLSQGDLKKAWVAAQIGITAPQMSVLLRPYPQTLPWLTDDILNRIDAWLLEQEGRTA